MAAVGSTNKQFSKSLRLLLICLSWLLIASQSAHAATPTMTCTLKLGEVYPVEQWMPVTIRLGNPTDRPLGGFVEFSAGRDNDLVIRQPANVPAHSELTVDSVIRAGVAARHRMPPGEITRAVWMDTDGRELCRASLSGIRIGGIASSQNQSGTDLPTTCLLVIDTLSDGGEHLETFIADDAGMQIARATASDASELPRSTIAYGGFDYVLLNTPPDELDSAQRQALLDHVRQGATLIVSGAFESAHLQASWLAEYLPVEIIGYRQASASHALPLLNTTCIAEAVQSGQSSHVVLSDATYVLAAVGQVGLGRIIFTSFPAEGLDMKNSAAKAAWHDLLNWRRTAPPSPAVADTLVKQRTAAMAQILGKTAPSWTLAAGIVGGYVLIVMAVQLGFVGTRRPMAFAVAAVMAVLISASVLLAGTLRSNQKTITGARLTWIDLGADGSGQLREQCAFFGSGAGELLGNSPRLECQPIEFDPHNAPMLQPLPFRTTDIGIRSDGIGRVWQATAAYHGGTVKVNGVFGPGGLQLRAENALPTPVRVPVMAWGSSVIRLKDFSSGHTESAVTPANLNPPGTFTHGDGIVTAIDALRGDLIHNMVGSIESDSTEPFVLGWLDDSAAPKLLNLKTESPAIIRGQMMLRASLVIDSSPAGAMVKVDAPFNRFTRYGDTAMPPLDAGGNASGNAEQSWLMVVTPPAAIGTLQPTHATLSVNLDTPECVVVVQSSTKKDAAPLATWSHAIGARSVSFDVTPADLSPQNKLVLRISVQIPSASSTGTRWSMQQLGVTLDATVSPH